MFKPLAIAKAKPPRPGLQADKLRDCPAILFDAGFPPEVIVIDFETFFTPEYNLRKMDTISYVTDPQFEVLGMSMAYSNTDDYAPVWYSGEDTVEKKIRAMQRVWGENLEGCTIAAYNARFDACILKWVYGISPKYLIDILGLANHWNARQRNRVEDWCTRLNLPAKGDTQKFKAWTYRNRTMRKGGRGKQKDLLVPMPIITPEMDRELGEYAKGDASNEAAIFQWLLPRVSRPNVELPLINHTLHLYLDPVFEVDVDKGNNLKQEMAAQLDADIEDTGLTRETISGTISFTKTLRDAVADAGDDPDFYMKKGKKGPIIATAKTDFQRELLLNHKNQYVRKLMVARTGLKSWPNHISRVDSIIRQYKNAGSILPVPLGYHNAHTGRAGGGEGINLQNLGSRGHHLVNSVRQMLIAPPGKTLVIGDQASVESRFTGWLGGEQWKLDAYEAGEEMYCRFAEKVLELPAGSLRKPVPEPYWEERGCDPEEEKYMKWARNTIGKTGDLACGFGGAEGAVARFAPDLDTDMLTKIKDTYRESHKSTVEFWNELLRKFIHTAKYGRPTKLGPGECIRLRQTPECSVVVTLPSGRELKYHRVNVRVDKETGRDRCSHFNGRTKSWENVWRGILMENIVQAMARDALMEALLNLEARGFHVIHHIHDELILCVVVAEAEEALAAAIEELSRTPDWAPGIPLGAEGVITPRYGDH
jgi:DNA polymerase